MRAKQLVCAALTLCICVGLALPVMGFGLEVDGSKDRYTKIVNSTYTEQEELFKDVLFEEDVKGMQIYEKQWVILFDRSSREDKHVGELNFATRRMGGSMTLTADRKIISEVRIKVDEASTLTVEKGMTLTINGSLLLKGKLINKGTIILALDSDAGEKKPSHGLLLCEGGTITNSGVIKVEKGAIENSGTLTNSGTMNFTGAKLTNTGEVKNSAVMSFKNSSISNMSAFENTTEGKITMTNDDKALRCVENTSIHKPDKIFRGSIDNKGDIEITTTAEVAVYSEKECTIANSGRIAVSKDAAVKGTITGNKHVVLK